MGPTRIVPRAAETGMPDAPGRNSYDEVPYPSHAAPRTHPDCLASVATLVGLRPPPVARCRVLELGCSDGGNLIPMAHALPDAEFVGIDASARQVADGGFLSTHPEQQQV